MAWEVEVGEQVADWLLTVPKGTFEQVYAAIDVLKEDGPGLGRPLVDSVRQSRHSNMKELRPGSEGKSEVRILFAFDKIRHAILLIAGDKSRDWNKWYDKNIPIADNLFEEHQRSITK